jgi:hypothetical protein
LGDGAGEDGDDAATGEQPERRRSSRESKRPEREVQIWLEAWNNGVETEKQSLQPPSVDLFLEVIESMVMKTEIECFDLIDRIGNEFDIDTTLFILQAAH